MKLLKIIILILSAVICTSCAATPALAYTIQGKVVYVYDGDTVLLKEIVTNPSVTYGDSSPIRGALSLNLPYTDTLRGALTRIRLASIDAPEKDQPYGTEATQLLKNLIQNKTVLANVIDTDKYGRKIAYIYLPNKTIYPEQTSFSTQNLAHTNPNLLTVNSYLLTAGSAWHYKSFDKNSAQYDLHYTLEQEARANKRGLWAILNPVAPWIWRIMAKYKPLA